MNLGSNQLFSGLLGVWKHYWTFRIWGSGFGCEDLILLCFCLQKLNDNI